MTRSTGGPALWPCSATQRWMRRRCAAMAAGTSCRHVPRRGAQNCGLGHAQHVDERGCMRVAPCVSLVRRGRGGGEAFPQRQPERRAGARARRRGAAIRRQRCGPCAKKPIWRARGARRAGTGRLQPGRAAPRREADAREPPGRAEPAAGLLQQQRQRHAEAARQRAGRRVGARRAAPRAGAALPQVRRLRPQPAAGRRARFRA